MPGRRPRRGLWWACRPQASPCWTGSRGLPALARATAGYRGRFTLIGVDCCGDNQSSVSRFLQELGVLGEFNKIAYDDDGRIAQSYALLGPPTTAFLDKDHVLRDLVPGAVTAVTLAQGLKEIGIT